MPKTKILIFSTAYHPFIGGAEIAIKEITSTLRGDFDFIIITSKFSRKLPRKEYTPEGEVIRVGLGSRIDKFLLPFLAMSKAVDLICKEKDQILLWGMDISAGSLAAAFIKLLRPQMRFVLSIQYGESEERLRYGRLGLNQLLFRFILKRADYITTLSNYLLAVARDYGYKKDASVVPNGVDWKKFSNASRSKKDNTIITASRLVYKNGIDVLIRAIGEVKKDIPDIKCLIIGDGPEKKQLESLVKNLELVQEVSFLGNIPHDDVPVYLHQASVFVRPSRSEGLGNAFLEALAAGLPIIGTSVGGILDIIEDKKTGLLVKVDDPINLAHKIKEVLLDEQLSKSMVRHGREVIQRKFTWDKISADFAKIFYKYSKYQYRLLVTTGIFPPEIGGPATYSSLLLKELPGLGYRIKIITYGDNYTESHPEVKIVSKKWPKGIKHLVYFFKTVFWGYRSDTILTADSSFGSAFIAVLASKILQKNIVMRITGDYAWEQAKKVFGIAGSVDNFSPENKPWKIKFLAWAQNFSVRNASRVITPSNYLKTTVLKWGVDPSKVVIIYNAIDLPAENQSKEEIRRKLGLHGRVVLSVGRLVPWKGFELLIGVISELTQNFADIQLIIAGDGPERSKLKDCARNCGINVLFTGNLSKKKLISYIKAADVFALNTAYEGFSHQIVEVMSLGVTVITTDVGGNTEIIEDGKNGLFAPYNDHTAWVSILGKILADPDFSKKIGLVGQESVKKFSLENLILNLNQLLSSL